MTFPHRVRYLCATFLLFCTALIAGVAARVHGQTNSAQAQQRLVAITIDDLPGAIPGSDKGMGDLKEYQRINRAIPAILAAHHVPAIGFVNERKVQVAGERDARTALLQIWLDAGMTLGNHTYSHASFQTMPLAQFEDETIRGEVVTRALMTSAGKPLTYFRHPFLETGPTPEAKAAFETFLKERGYKVAPVTVDNSDWMFNDLFGRALEKKDKKLAAKTKAAYLEYEETIRAYFESVSRTLFGREIAEIYLLHDNAINVECLDALLTHLEKLGYKFVSLDEALTDPAYATPDQYIGAQGISWLTRWKISFGQKADFEHDPDPPKWVLQMDEEIRKSRTH
ncbi:MAG: polysaccharide deacetylase family protein [Candidatus Acidiferrales bacterium]